MSDNSPLRLSNERGVRLGFRNMLRKENGAWWKTKTWWIQTLIWVAIINGVAAGVLFASGTNGSQTGIEVAGQLRENLSVATIIFSLMTGMAPVIGMIIMMQDALIEEKQAGTAAWVLSKPLGRSAFFLSKLLANMTGTFVAMSLIPGIVFYFEIYAATGTWLDVGSLVAAIGLIYLNLLFYLTLTLMLGTLFNVRGPVIAIPMVTAFSAQFLGNVWILNQIMPWVINWPLLNDGEGSLISYMLLEQTLPVVTPIITTIILCVFFVLIGFWKINREEF